MPPIIDIADMTYQDGTPNPSGLATMHGITLLSDYTTIQVAKEINDAAATAINVGSIVTPHVFADSKCMRKLYGTENKGEVKDDTVGDPDSQNGKVTVTIVSPGLDVNRISQRKRLNASQGILFTTQADGQVLQHGSERFPCHFKVTWGSDKNEGYRGYTLTATCYGDSIIYTPGLNFTPAEA